ALPGTGQAPARSRKRCVRTWTRVGVALIERATLPNYLGRVNPKLEIFDRALLRWRRNRTAAHASQHDFLIAHVADDLMQRLAMVRRRFPVAVNLGAQHGLLGQRLGALPGVELVIDMEPTGCLLRQCSGLRLQADEEALPFRGQSLDLV